MKVLTLVFAAAAPLATAITQAPVAQAVDLMTAAPVAGAWNYSAQAGGSGATFVDVRGIVRVTLRCTRATRRVTFSAPSAIPSTAMTITTSSMSRPMAARYDPQTRNVAAELAAFDPMLDAVAFSRGRFSITIAGSAALVLPATPEPARVVEDCRN